MNFIVNNDTWSIKEVESEELRKIYQEEMEEKVYYVFGVTRKHDHVILLNKELCKDQKIKTLKHELTHVYIWEFGLYNVTDANEEMICDLVACSNDFINRIVELWEKSEIEKKCGDN